MRTTRHRYRLTLAYDGTRYSGWQKQRGSATIQGTLEAALGRLFGECSGVTGSGRTDAGVHAVGQVAHVDLVHVLAPEKLRRALNGQLPPDIRVRFVNEVPLSFHARYHARRRRYVYLLRLVREPSPFLIHYTHQVDPSLDRQAMQEAASRLVGTHDFSAFRASGGARTRPVRTVFRSEILPLRGDLVAYVIEADAFLRKMVRGIVGTLLEIGGGMTSPGLMDRLLSSRDRSLMGTLAPPQGLYLAAVFYGEGAMGGREKADG